MNKRRICALLLSGVIAISVFGCSSSGTEEGSQSTEGESATTAQSDNASESLEEQETTVMATEAETSETTVETTVTKPTETINASIDDFFNAIVTDYFEMNASYDMNEDMTGSIGALGPNGNFNIFEFKSTEGLKVGDQITILSTNPSDNGTAYDYTIAAINGQYVLIAVEWDADYVTNDHAPYTNPNVQAVYDAFVAFEG